MPVKKLDPWYVTGLVEGEGCFTYSRSGSRLALYFAVKLTGADDTLLEALQRFFGGAGTLYRIRPRAPTARAGATKAASYYRVCRREQLRKILEHFDAYPLRGVKAASYRIWRLMALLRLEFPKTSQDRLDLFAAQLSAAAPKRAVSSAAEEGAAARKDQPPDRDSSA